MAGRDYTGTSRGEFDPGAARAFCEGMQARIASASATNPYSDPDLIEEIAWDAGAAAAAADAGSTISNSLNCAVDTGATIPS